MAHEVSITVDSPTTPGKYINLPLQVPGNDLSNVHRGERPTPEQVQRALEYADAHGRPDTAEYDSITEAEAVAGSRSDSFTSEGTKAGVPVAPAPQTAVPPAVKPQATAPRGDLIPLQEYFRRRQVEIDSPTGARTSVDQMVQQGARALIPRLRGPVELPKGDRVVPKTLTDVQPVATQYRQKLAESGPDFEDVPATVARPFEIQTPREQATRSEVERIIELLDRLLPEAPGA